MGVVKVSGNIPPRTARTAVIPEKPSPKEPTEEKITCTCDVCGRSTRRPGLSFYHLPGRRTTNKNGGYARICKNCIDDLFQSVMKDSGDLYTAVEICCHYLDLPYIKDIARLTAGVKVYKPMTEYVKAVSVAAYADLTYTDTIMDKGASEAVEKVTGTSEREWDKDSVYNMNYVKGIMGYDPFDDEGYTDSDRRYLYNTTASYCPDSNTANDSHRLNAIINIVKLLLQVNKITEVINFELAKPIGEQGDVSKMVSIQSSLLQSIDRMAEKNSISRSKGSIGSNTISQRMKTLQDEGFRAIEVNAFEIEQSKRLQELADMSARAVVQTINLDDTDYAEIIQEQRDMVVKLSRENKRLAEENRVLTNEKTAWLEATAKKE